MQQPILTPQQLEAYNRGEAVTIQKVKEVKRETPKTNEIYCSVFDGLFSTITHRNWCDDWETQNWYWQNYLSFYTKEELQKEMQYIEARSYIRTYIANNFGEWKPDWSNHEPKFSLYFNSDLDVWKEEEHMYSQKLLAFPYLKTKEQCDQLIRDCEPQLNILRDFWN